MEYKKESAQALHLEDLYKALEESASIFENTSLDCEIVYYDEAGMQQLLVSNTSIETVLEAIQELKVLIPGKMGLPREVIFAFLSIPKDEILTRIPNRYDIVWKHTVIIS